MTTKGFVAIKNATYGGVYYTADFTLSGAITWTKLTTNGLASLVVTNFKVDPYNPLNRQYVIADNVLYTRNGGDWSSIMDIATAATLTGALNIGTPESLQLAWPDPTVEGSIYCVYHSRSTTSQALFILKSLDYGANWTSLWAPYDSVGSGPYDMQVYGNTIWITHDKNYPPNVVIDYTANAGSTYSRRSGGYGGLMVNPHDITECYSGPAAGVSPAASLVRWDWGTSPEYNYLQAGIGDVFYESFRNGEKFWIDPVTPNHQRMSRSSTILYTSDGWATYSTTAYSPSGTTTTPCQCTSPQNTGDTTAVIVGRSADTNGAYRSTVYAFSDETDTTGDIRNGANSETTYVDSVPSNLLLADRTPIWVGEAPSSTGVYVYSVEMESDTGWTTDVTDYDKIGSPMGGDRASFRDLPEDGFDVYHAEDVHAGTPQIHAPWDDASPPGAGYGIISDGTKWEVSSGTIALTSDLHDEVTLAADADKMLGISGQQLLMDPVDANKVWAGPTSGAAADPDYRALVAGDLPAIALNDLSDVDTSGVATGDIIYKTSGNWEEYPLGIGTNIANDGGSIKIGDIANGDYLQVSSVGEVTLTGDATAWEDLRVEPTVRAAAGAGVPAFEKYFDDLAGTSKGVYLYSFTDEAVAGNEKEVFFTMQMPHAWKLGSDISFHVHFVPSATVASSDIIWGLEYTWKSIGEVFGDTTIVYSSTTLLPDDANITAGKHYLAEFTDLSPGTTASSLSSILIGRLFRNSSAAGDTYTDKVGLLYIDAHYQVDSFGSYDEYSKGTTLADSDGMVLADSDGTELTDSVG